MEQSSELLHDPKLNPKTHCRNTLFLVTFLAKKGYYGNDFLGLPNLAHFYMISS